MINDDIVKRIDTLISELVQMKSEYNEKLSEKETQISKLVSQLEEREKSVSSIEKRAIEAINSIEEKESKFTELSKSSEALQILVDKNTHDMNGVEKSLSELQKKLENQEKYSIEIEGFLIQFDSIKNESSALESSLNSIREDLAFMESVYTNLSKQNDSLRQTQSLTCKDVKNTEENIKSCMDSVGGLQNKIKQMKEYFEKSLSELQKKLESQEKYSTEIEGFLVQFESIKNNSSELESSLNSIRQGLTFTESAYTNLSKQNDSLQQTQSLIGEDVKNTEENIKSCMESMAVLQDKAKQMEEYFEKSLKAERKINAFEKAQKAHQDEIQHINDCIDKINNSFCKLQYHLETIENDLKRSAQTQKNVTEKWGTLNKEFDKWFTDENTFKEYILEVASQNLCAVKDGVFGVSNYSIRKKFN